MGVVRRTIWHTGVYGAGLMANRGISFLLLPLYSRVWHEQIAEMSIWDLSTTTVLFLVPFVEVGLATALLRFYYLVDNERACRRLFSTSLALVSLLSCCCVILGWIFAVPLARLIFGSAEYAVLVRLMAGLAVATVIGNQPLALLRAQERSAAYAALNLLRAVLGPPVIVLLVVHFDMGAAGVLWGDFIGLSALALGGMWVCRKSYVPAFDIGFARRMLRFGIPLLPCGLATVVVMVSDRYILKEVFGLAAMAPYSFGYKLAIMMSLVTRAMQIAWPAASFQLANESNGRAILAQIHKFVLAVVLFAALGLAAFAPELVHVVGTRALSSATPFVPWFAFSYAAYMALLLFGTNATIAHKTSQIAAVYVMGAAAKIVLTLALIRVTGMEGAAQATFIAFVLEAAAAYWVGQRVYPLPYERGRMAALVAAGCGCGAGCYLAYGIPYLASLLVRLGMLASFVTVVFAFGIISPQERKRIGGVFRRRPGGQAIV